MNRSSDGRAVIARHLLDAKGVIRYKYISPITSEVIATELLPRISLLKQEAAK